MIHYHPLGARYASAWAGSCFLSHTCITCIYLVFPWNSLLPQELDRQVKKVSISRVKGSGAVKSKLDDLSSMLRFHDELFIQKNTLRLAKPIGIPHATHPRHPAGRVKRVSAPPGPTFKNTFHLPSWLSFRR